MDNGDRVWNGIVSSSRDEVELDVQFYFYESNFIGIQK